MERYVTIHGHFYQPPRENPWLEAVEVQDSAYPYHDWNDRITAECYGPNGASRILDAERTIVDIVNNYERISCNFGPTLMTWMEKSAPKTYEAVLEADRLSKARFNGHGSALATCYNHLIMPLASRRDKETQVIWGVEDFVGRYKRQPEGMWLPETAVDYESLEIMAAQGILFTILSPHQAKEFRPLGGSDWTGVGPEGIDTHMPYRCVLPNGRSMVIFFFDRKIADEVAFGTLLDNGEQFANRLAAAFSGDAPSQLVSIASDGETYGHHHRFGDMALAYCLYHIEKNQLATLTIYGEHLERCPPTYEVHVLENTSWSCPHGVERWRGNCGCGMQQRAGWSWAWREPLRGALDWLRDNCDQLFEEVAGKLVDDPWALRDEYIRAILDRSAQTQETVFAAHAKAALSPAQSVLLSKLCEMQRHTQLMYTSCGWFFDDISGIEAVQVIAYAARAMQLASEVSAIRFEEAFVKLLDRAKSNLPQFASGTGVYNQLVKPASLDLFRIVAHYAMSSLFEEFAESSRVYSYILTRLSGDRAALGSRKLAVGTLRVHADTTGDDATFVYIVLLTGDNEIVCGVGAAQEGDETLAKVVTDVQNKFAKSDTPACINLLQKHFANRIYTLWQLLKDAQRTILRQILSGSMADVESTFRQIKDRWSPLMQATRQAGLPLPRAFQIIGDYLVNTDLSATLTGSTLDTEKLRTIVEEGQRFSFEIDRVTLGYRASAMLASCFANLERDSGDPGLLATAVGLFQSLQPLSLDLSLGGAQNTYFRIGKQLCASKKAGAAKGNADDGQWVDLFGKLGGYLNVRFD